MPEVEKAARWTPAEQAKVQTFLQKQAAKQVGMMVVKGVALDKIAKAMGIWMSLPTAAHVAE